MSPVSESYTGLMSVSTGLWFSQALGKAAQPLGESELPSSPNISTADWHAVTTQLSRCHTHVKDHSFWIPRHPLSRVALVFSDQFPPQKKVPVGAFCCPAASVWPWG